METTGGDNPNVRSHHTLHPLITPDNDHIDVVASDLVLTVSMLYATRDY